VSPLARVVDHPLERPPARADALDRGDLLAQGQDRLDLQRRAEPGLGGPDPPALAQVLERVDREPHLELLAAVLRRGQRPGAVRTSRRRGSGREHHHPLPAARGAAVVHVNALAALPLGDQALLRLRGGLAGPGDARGQVDRDDVPALRQQGLVDGAEVAYRRLRGRRALSAGPEALEELGVLVPGDLDLRPLPTLERDVEADPLDVVLGDQLLREIGRRIGDDGGLGVGGHSAVLSLRPRGSRSRRLRAASTIGPWARLWSRVAAASSARTLSARWPRAATTCGCCCGEAPASTSSRTSSSSARAATSWIAAPSAGRCRASIASST